MSAQLSLLDLTPVKRCSKCGETKPVDAFNNQRSRPDGRFPWCRPCAKAYKAHYREHGRQPILSTAERLWPKVDKNGPTPEHVAHLGPCWVWTGTAHLGFGYGLIHHKGRNQPTHRVSWQLEIGPIPDDLCVLHKCDNPPCVRPSHLFLGTRAENIADKTAKGRQDKGVQIHFARLNPDKVREARAMFASGSLHREIAERFGVHPATITYLLNGKTWRHVT